MSFKKWLGQKLRKFCDQCPDCGHDLWQYADTRDKFSYKKGEKYCPECGWPRSREKCCEDGSCFMHKLNPYTFNWWKGKIHE